MSNSGIVNVRMVITEEKILSNIDKVQKMINPKSKKQIIQLEDDSYFKDLIESVKTYLIEYPKKRNFPVSVYKAAYELVEFATNQFEENTKQIEELIRQREGNIATARVLKDALETVQDKEEGWKQTVKELENRFSEDIIETLNIIGKCKSDKSQNYLDAVKLINARIINLESNLHIEIDMERIEDRSKALSYIGIEIADALKLIPTPEENAENMNDIEEEEYVESMEKVEVSSPVQEEIRENVVAAVDQKAKEQEKYEEQTTFEVKPSLWQKIKESKLGRAFRYIFRVKIVLETPALSEGHHE